MPRRRRQSSNGVPEWIVTYGDMMTLLLCFFILLAAFSELKKDDEYQEMVQAIKQRFGYTGGNGNLPTERKPEVSIIEQPEAVSLHDKRFKQISAANDPGVRGKQTTVQRVREGLQFTVGGRVTFERGSVELQEEAKRQLAQIVERIRGLNNKLEVRGHAASGDAEAGATPEELWDISYARAQAVRRFLTSDGQGIDPRRIRVIACADNEPLRSRAYDPSAAALNRRVELILIESLVQDFQAPTQPAGVEPLR